jgi:hypothetical protein
LKAEPFEPRPFESGLLDVLLNDEDGRRQESVSLDRMRPLAQGERWRAWAESLETELILQGLLKPGRVDRRRRLLRMSLTPLALAMLVSCVAIFFYGTFGRWPFYLAVALLVQAMAWRHVAAHFRILSDEGAQSAAEWRRFYRYLSLVSRGSRWPASDEECVEYLPYAAAYGLATSWVRSFRRRSLPVTPDFFRPVDADSSTTLNGANAFVAMVSVAGQPVQMNDGRGRWDLLGGAGLTGLLRMRQKIRQPHGWQMSESPD